MIHGDSSKPLSLFHRTDADEKRPPSSAQPYRVCSPWRTCVHPETSFCLPRLHPHGSLADSGSGTVALRILQTSSSPFVGTPPNRWHVTVSGTPWFLQVRSSFSLSRKQTLWSRGRAARCCSSRRRNRFFHIDLSSQQVCFPAHKSSSRPCACSRVFIAISTQVSN